LLLRWWVLGVGGLDGGGGGGCWAFGGGWIVVVGVEHGFV